MITFVCKHNEIPTKDYNQRWQLKMAEFKNKVHIHGLLLQPPTQSSLPLRALKAPGGREPGYFIILNRSENAFIQVECIAVNC